MSAQMICFRTDAETLHAQAILPEFKCRRVNGELPQDHSAFDDVVFCSPDQSEREAAHGVLTRGKFSRIRTIDLAILSIPATAIDAVELLREAARQRTTSEWRAPASAPADSDSPPLAAYVKDARKERTGRTERDAAPEASLVVECVANIKAKPIRWLWPQRFARGKVSIVAGDPKLGKSQVSVFMAAIVSTDGAWPDGTPCERGSVLILSAEDDAADTIRPRLEAAGADLSRCHILHAVRQGFSPDGDELQRQFSLALDIRRLEEALVQLGSVALIIIDPVSAYLGGTDSHKNADVRALLSPLSAMASRAGVAVVAISHFNKGGASSGGNALLRVTGSLAFVAAARSAYIVAKDPADAARRLFLPAGGNVGPECDGLAFKVEGVKTAGGIETSRIVWEPEPVTGISADDAIRPAEGDEQSSATDEAKDWLRKLLKAGPMKATDVQKEAREAGISDKALRTARERLGIKPHKRDFVGGWWWSWSAPLSVPKMPEDAEDALPYITGTLGTLGASSAAAIDPEDTAEAADKYRKASNGE